MSWSGSSPPVWFSPDGAFAVRLLHGEDPARLTMALLDDLYRADLGLARHTLLAARSEPTAELEEQSYRWRSGRLADLGYVDFYDALALFAPLTVEQYAAEPTAPATPLEVDAAPLPVVVAEALLGKSFLARAWDRAVTEAPAAHERLQHALVTLVNTVLAAARVRPGDSSALGAAATYATATLSLGLESVSRGDLARAAALLPDASLNRLHRVGFTATARLAKVGASALGLGQWLRLGKGEDKSGGRSKRSILADAFEAVIAAVYLDGGYSAAAEMVERLLAHRIDNVEHTGFYDFKTRLQEMALARWLAAGQLAAHALSVAELVAARAALRAGVDRAAAVAAVAALLGDDGGRSPKLAELLADLELDAGLDPRFIDGVLVAATARA